MLSLLNASSRTLFILLGFRSLGSLPSTLNNRCREVGQLSSFLTLDSNKLAPPTVHYRYLAGPSVSLFEPFSATCRGPPQQHLSFSQNVSPVISASWTVKR